MFKLYYPMSNCTRVVMLDDRQRDGHTDRNIWTDIHNYSINIRKHKKNIRKQARQMTCIIYK